MDKSGPNRATELFLQHLAASAREKVEAVRELDMLLESILAAARSTHPDIPLEDEEFLAYLASHLPQDEDPVEALDRLHASELYLACACSKAVPAALDHVQSVLLPGIDQALWRMSLTKDTIDDIKQNLFRKLFTSDGVQEPKIMQYAGRGELKGWLRVVAVREALNILRQLRPEKNLHDSELVNRVQIAEDPELAYCKTLYQEEFKQAFEQGLADLSVRDRTILRYYLLDGLNIEQIGRIYQVHRATVARWIAKIRQRLLEDTRQALTCKLNVTTQELDSIMRLINSQLDVSIRRHLETRKPD